MALTLEPGRGARCFRLGRRIRISLWLLGTVAGLALVLRQGGLPFFDGVCYYVIDLDHLYAIAAVSMQAYGAYRYSPILAQILDPFGSLPLGAFIAAWTSLLILALVYIGRRRWWLLLGLPFVMLELYAGNVHILMAAAVVAGFRWPGAWAFLALTKVTPFVGVFWFAIRREWRHFAVALGVTGAIVGLGVVLSPDLWGQWFDSLQLAAGSPALGVGGPLLLRLPIALVVLAWAAPRNHRWALPVVVILAMPNIWIHSLAILAASAGLWWAGHGQGAAGVSPVSVTAA